MSNNYVAIGSKLNSIIAKNSAVYFDKLRFGLMKKKLYNDKVIDEIIFLNTIQNVSSSLLGNLTDIYSLSEDFIGYSEFDLSNQVKYTTFSFLNNPAREV